MKIFVTAKPNARQEMVEKIEDTHFVVRVKELPKKGRANRAIVKKLAEYFNIPASRITLLNGFSSKNKVFEINI